MDVFPYLPYTNWMNSEALRQVWAIDPTRLMNSMAGIKPPLTYL